MPGLRRSSPWKAIAAALTLAAATPASAGPTAPDPAARLHAAAGLLLIELKISACRDAECREFSVLFDPYDVSMMTCMVAGQQQAAIWSESHPGWNITRWSCSVQGSRALDA